jgi:hypothetical protein
MLVVESATAVGGKEVALAGIGCISNGPSIQDVYVVVPHGSPCEGLIRFSVLFCHFRSAEHCPGLTGFLSVLLNTAPA